MGISVDIYY